MDAMADNTSLDSLSFAGLLCIKDQQSNSLPTRQINKPDPEFEFSLANPKSTHYSNTNATAEVSISNSQLQLHTLLYQSKQSEVKNKPCFKERIAESPNSHFANISQKTNHNVRKQPKERAAKSSSFGSKLFQSFVSPCRECHACQPTVIASTKPQENIKLHYL